MRNSAMFMICAIILWSAACSSPPATNPGVAQFEQLERELQAAGTSDEECDAMQRMNRWLLSDEYDAASCSFGLSWTVGDATTPAPEDISAWLDDHPEEAIWVHPKFTSGGEKRQFSYRLVNPVNWYLLTLNE
jgi:hypothetical protein